MKLKRLKIDKLRNIAPGTELYFRDSLNVILGKNGTGKTTLLNLIVQLLRWDYSSLCKEPVSLEYDLATQHMDLTINLRSEQRTDPLEVSSASYSRHLLQDRLSDLIQKSRYIIADIDIIAPRQRFYRCGIHIDGPRISLTHERLPERWDLGLEVALLEAPEFFQYNVFAKLFFAQLPDEFAGLVNSFGHAINHEFPGAVSRLDECTAYLDLLTSDSSGHLVSSGDTGHAEQPRYYSLSSLLGTAQPLQDATGEVLLANPDADTIRLPVSRTGQGLLPRLVNLLDFSSLTIRLERLERQQERIRFSGPRFEFLLPDGTILNHQLLSYGQKRLLSFYYYLESNPHFVVADELVNGMHHEWIEACLEDLGDRQAFLTSQNPLLLDYLTFESAEEVRSSFILCRSEKTDGQVRLYWENMRPEEAEEFFKAYQVGIQHVSSILRTGGLW